MMNKGIESVNCERCTKSTVFTRRRYEAEVADHRRPVVLGYHLIEAALAMGLDVTAGVRKKSQVDHLADFQILVHLHLISATGSASYRNSKKADTTISFMRQEPPGPLPKGNTTRPTPSLRRSWPRRRKSPCPRSKSWCLSVVWRPSALWTTWKASLRRNPTTPGDGLRTEQVTG